MKLCPICNNYFGDLNKHIFSKHKNLVFYDTKGDYYE